MAEFEKFEVGDLVFSNEDHPLLGVEGTSPGLVTEVMEDSFGAQVEVAVAFYPDNNEVRFTPQELTIVGRNGDLTTFEYIKNGDRIMMINPNEELVKVLVEDVFRQGNLIDIFGSDADDDMDTFGFTLTADTEVFKVSA